MAPDPRSCPASPAPAAGFDFGFAVRSPFRMQPGLRRVAADSPLLTPLAAGSRAQREKLAVLSAFPGDALLRRPGFDEGPALDGLLRRAAQAWPDHFRWDGRQAQALALGLVVEAAGRAEATRPGGFGLGDELLRCLQGLDPRWRLAGLLALAFEEDLAIVDGDTGCLAWLAVCLPSFWAPQTKIGRRFADVHAPVADNERLLAAADALVRLVTGPDRWERFVWTVTPHPRLHGHPARTDPRGWDLTPVSSAWFRTERQTFLPVVAPAGAQAVFTIRVGLSPLADIMRSPEQARALRDALASQTPEVRRYRQLDAVAEALIDWLDARAGRPVPGPIAPVPRPWADGPPAPDAAASP